VQLGRVHTPLIYLNSKTFPGVELGAEGCTAKTARKVARKNRAFFFFRYVMFLLSREPNRRARFEGGVQCEGRPGRRPGKKTTFPANRWRGMPLLKPKTFSPSRKRSLFFFSESGSPGNGLFPRVRFSAPAVPSIDFLRMWAWAIPRFFWRGWYGGLRQPSSPSHRE